MTEFNMACFATHPIGYVREIEEDDQMWWVLFDEDGNRLCQTSSRSTPFFVAADRGIEIKMLN